MITEFHSYSSYFKYSYWSLLRDPLPCIHIIPLIIKMFSIIQPMRCKQICSDWFDVKVRLEKSTTTMKNIGDISS